MFLQASITERTGQSPLKETCSLQQRAAPIAANMMECQSQMARVSIKAYYLDKDERVAEIRRFSLSSPPSITNLVEKVRSLFDLDKSQNVRTQWLDSEGERITFSTDEELSNALSFASAAAAAAASSIAPGNADDATLRVYISCPSPLIPASKNSVTHPDVICDGCNQPVRGYRFKCVICADFDLCCHCVVINRHCEHPMIMLRRPRDPFICKLSKWNRSQWARRCRQGGDQRDLGSGVGSVAGASGIGDCASLPTDDCMRILRQLEAAAMKVLHRQHHQQQPPQPPLAPCPFSEAALDYNRCPSSASGMLRRDSVASSLAGIGAAESFVDCGGVGEPEATNQESIINFVHNMSNSLNALLQPLGIEVSYHHHAIPSAGASADPGEGDADEESSAMATDEQAVVSPQPPSQAPPPLQPPPPPPPLQRRPPMTQHLPENVARSLEQMRGMGFTDEDGRLGQLLLAANGDISRVLDELRQN